MQLFIKTLEKKTITLDVEPSYTVWEVKAMIQEIEGIPPEEQKLIYIGKILDDDRQLGRCAIGKDTTHYLVTKHKSG